MVFLSSEVSAGTIFREPLHSTAARSSCETFTFVNYLCGAVDQLDLTG